MAWIAAPGAAARPMDPRAAARLLAETPHLLLNAPLVAARLGLPECSGLDLLELFAFVHPARFLVPSAAGLAGSLGLPAPQGPAAEAAFLARAAAALLAGLGAPGWPARAGAFESAHRLARRGWGWATEVLSRLPPPPRPEASLFEALPRFEEAPPRPPPQVVRLTGSEVDAALDRLRGDRREPRPRQRAYARAMLHAFQPKEDREGPNLVVAEAGTGIGKTIGYLAPAALHAERTGGAVWLSTYTRALQRQLRAETRASLPERLGGRAIAVRKGRENYLCLLNLEDALQAGATGRSAILVELVARWARFTADGDMVGGDLPGWLPGLFRARGALPALSDRRGECIRGACPHFRACFIERSVRASQQAALVIANHALTMSVAVRSGSDIPRRLVFDEGHHLFDAADSAFALLFSGSEAIELRRWILGPEKSGRKGGRRRGLAARLLDVSAHDEAGASALGAVERAAMALPADQWLDRLGADEPEGPIETLLALVRRQVLTRAEDSELGHSLETAIADLLPGLVEAAEAAGRALATLRRAMTRLGVALERIATGRPDWLDAPGLARIEAAHAGLADRVELLDSWGRMLARLGGTPDPRFVDWFGVVRAGGIERDVGLFRHWLDPLEPLARAVLGPADGVAVTSATLAGPGDPDTALAEAVGARHLATAPQLFRAASPFDHAAQARVFIATDVTPRDPAMLALALARLIRAAGGGTLGLFTAIARLRAVHARLADQLAAEGLPLYAQHVDPMDAGTLVDLFRADPRASLLGTDALRDGVDVPGESLRLVVFEGVPWSRPTILETARRAAGGGQAHEDRQVRRRLAQAFGRLIRRADDRGVFVLLGPQVPSRLLTAFPDGVPVRRLPLAEVVAETGSFLGGACQPPAAFLGGSACAEGWGCGR